MSSGQIVKWISMSCYQRAKRSLWTCTLRNWNVCNRHCKKRKKKKNKSQHWWITECTLPSWNCKLSEWPSIPYNDLVWRVYAILLTQLTLSHPITHLSLSVQSPSWKTFTCEVDFSQLYWLPCTFHRCQKKRMSITDLWQSWRDVKWSYSVKDVKECQWNCVQH